MTDYDDVIYVDEQGERTDALREWRKLDAKSALYRELRRRFLTDGALAIELANFMAYHLEIKRRFLTSWYPTRVLVRVAPTQTGEGNER